jgi:hypothetical protein
LPKSREIHIGTVGDDNRFAGNRNPTSDPNISGFGIRQHDKAGHVIVMVEQNMRLDAPFALLKAGPGEQVQTQRNCCGVERQQFVFESKTLRARPQQLLLAKPVQCRPEQILEQRGGTMLIRIRQRRTMRRSRNTQMHQLSQTATQPITNFTQRIGAGHLAEQHRHELSPTRKPFGPAFCTMFADQICEFGPGEMFEKLIEQTRDLYHFRALLFGNRRDTFAIESSCHGDETLEGFLL